MFSGAGCALPSAKWLKGPLLLAGRARDLHANPARIPDAKVVAVRN